MRGAQDRNALEEGGGGGGGGLQEGGNSGCGRDHWWLDKQGAGWRVQPGWRAVGGDRGGWQG